jgi:hypothetical protein
MAVEMDRRRFLETSVGAAIGMSSLSSVDRLRQVTRRKPAFTGRTMTAQIPPADRVEDRRRLATAVRQNLIGYARENFELTELQVKQLQSLSPESVKAMNDAIDKAIADRLKIEVKAGCDTPEGGARSKTHSRMTVAPLFSPTTLTLNFETH